MPNDPMNVITDIQLFQRRRVVQELNSKALEPPKCKSKDPYPFLKLSQRKVSSNFHNLKTEWSPHTLLLCSANVNPFCQGGRIR